MGIRRQGSINVSDAKICVWEDDSNCEEEIKKQVILRLARFLKDHGWEFHVPYADYDWLYKERGTPKNRPHFAEKHRKGIKDGLEMEISVSGRHLEIIMWEDVADHSDDNSNGGRHIFDKESKMPYRQRCRCLATKLKIIRFLTTYHDYQMSEKCKPILPKKLTAMEKLERSYKDSWHKENEIFAPENLQVDSYNAKSAEGLQLTHGQMVWTTDYNGRLIQGIAYHNINNMWWVICGKWDRYNKASFEIFANKPSNLRERMPKNVRAKKIKAHISKAVDKQDFLKAHALKLALHQLDESIELEAA